MRISAASSLFTLVLAGFVLLGCGGDAPETTTTTDTTPETTAPSTDVSGTAPMQSFSDDGDVAEITIEGNDMIQFNIDEFSVRPGQMVRLTLNHVGSLPAQAMGHNVVIIYPDDDVIEFGGDVGMEGGSAANDYVPETLRDRVVAFTEMIGGGESTTVEFQAPDEPGDYPFLCSFPGHFAQMNGIMSVE